MYIFRAHFTPLYFQRATFSLLQQKAERVAARAINCGGRQTKFKASVLLFSGPAGATQLLTTSQTARNTPGANLIFSPFLRWPESLLLPRDSQWHSLCALHFYKYISAEVSRERDTHTRTPSSTLKIYELKSDESNWRQKGDQPVTAWVRSCIMEFVFVCNTTL